MFTRRRWTVLIGLTLLSLIASACGAPAAPTAQPTPAPVAVASPTVVVAPPTAVPIAPTAVPPAPTATSVPPTATSPAPTPTAVAATATTVSATATAVPATATSAPTAVPATATKAAAQPTATPTETVEVPRPSNAGGPGPAVNLTGDIKNGIAVFNSKAQDKNCATCHGPEGKGNVPNPGSTDGTVPPLNPIDDALKDKDPKVFATNIDLYLEHGSTPDGPNPQLTMPAWGDEKKLSPQEIADVIAYVMSLNQ
jgi:mono/diheme cytochrome c family protein